MAKYPDPMTDRNWGVKQRQTASTNPHVEVSARKDKVILGPKGEVLVRIVDRPIGFHGGRS